MKSYEKMKAMLLHQKAAVIALKRKHSKLNQIDMLSGEGTAVREQINQAKGKVAALEWAILDHVTEI